MYDMTWEGVAREVLQQEKSRKPLNYPEPAGALIEWQDNTYIGHIQEIVPDYSKEIVALSKTSFPLPNELVEAIRKLDAKRLELHADDSLDLSGRQHVLRRVEGRLTHMTPKQTEYMLEHPPIIYEL